MLDLLVWAFWFIFGAYSSWFFFKAKTFQPLTLDDLALTWKLHKQQTRCTASRLHSLLTKNDEVVGFKCDCGYEFLQKRLITQKIQKHAQTNIVPLASAKGIVPLAFSKGTSSLRRTTDSLKDLDLHRTDIREI